MSFIETPTSTRHLTALLTNGDYRDLQFVLLESPRAGRVILKPEARKLRLRAKGKSDGVRLIYYLSEAAAGEMIIFPCC